MTDNEIPAKSEWADLSINQLHDARSKMQSKYLMLAGISASFSSQYLKFIDEIDFLIKKQEAAVENN
jgi:hypothetical protein